MGVGFLKLSHTRFVVILFQLHSLLQTKFFFGNFFPLVTLGTKGRLNWGKCTIRAELDQHVQSLGDGRQVEILCVVHGYHIYKDMWDPYLGDDFTTKHERNNPHDKYAVVVLSVDAKSKR